MKNKDGQSKSFLGNIGNKKTDPDLSKGKDQSFTSVYLAYADDLFTYGLGLGFDRETVKDTMQDIFCKLYFDGKDLQDIISIKPYLFTMLRNKLYDLYRHEVDMQEISRYEMSFSITSNILDELITEEEQTLLRASIERLLSKLTDRQREAVYLRFIQQIEYDQIGRMLKMSGHAVRKLVSRAVKRMREE